MFGVAPPLRYRWYTQLQFAFSLRRKNIKNDIIASWLKMVRRNVKVNARKKANAGLDINVMIKYKINTIS
jgi:hypothetical protein